jgi:serine protease inhibitor
MSIRQLLRTLIPMVLIMVVVVAPDLVNGVQSIPTQSLVEGNTAFALDLYARLKKQPGNLFFSPYSISTCLSAVYAGARGDTEKQMAQALHLQPSQLSSAMGRLKRELNDIGKENGIELSVADALWTQTGHPFLPDFLKIVENEYQANLKQADFKTDAESARGEINRWISQKTREKIRNLLPPKSLDPQTKIVLANAVYFKGAWSRPFEKSATKSLPFHLTPSTEVRAAFMNHIDSVKYMESADFQAIELPYGKPKQELAMLALLPRQIDGSGQLESRLNPALLRNLDSQFKSQSVEIFFPKFKLDSSCSLKNVLSEMGMPAAFTTPAANFSGIDGTHQLFLSLVFHKAWCDVNEEGTEAAAATVIGALAGSVRREPLPPPPVFRADHPFLFMIRDMHTGSLLFIGRVTDPSK